MFANDIENGKRRSDIGVTYADDVLRLMDIFRARGLANLAGDFDDGATLQGVAHRASE